jgi:hypothetical protein
MSSLFLESALNLTEQSLDDIHSHHYLRSWMLTVPARVTYAMNAVSCAVAIPFSMIGLFFRSLEYVFTWGNSHNKFENSLFNLNLAINRLFSSCVGALISTHWGYNLHGKKSDQPFEWSLLLGMVGIGALAASSCPPPRYFFYSPQGGFSFGWDLGR